MRLAFLAIGRHIHTERWIRWFAGRGHDCHLLTVQPGPIDGVTVHDITRAGPGKPLRYWRSLGEVRRLLGQLRPDLLNTHFLTGYGYWGHYCGVHPNLLTVWGDDVYVTPFSHPLKGWLARRALASCDALTGDSVDILDVACRRLGADPARAFRVLWGVDFATFRPGEAPGVRSRLGFDESAIVFFSPRSYTQPYYNIDVIIAAAARVAGVEPRARFLFSGYEGDPAPFEAQVRAAGLDRVSRVLGRIPHAEFAETLRASDVFLSVPSVDATAVSLLEAMSCGRAPIVSALPSALEWVQEGISGRVVAPRDVDQLAAAMLDYARRPADRQAHGEAAWRTAQSHFGFEVNMARVSAICQRLVTGRGDWPLDVSLPYLRDGKVAACSSRS
ncbi:MAG TPA: glycosyltransferase [Candidatus Krumholzibacteria bacterium]|nr:glycosyltransferase [Candidatus Krumholzibacteria bacterium]HPD71506.1 glycosyltransferase [Candidatus Krumholzibacteria bacterium]HRY41561.1 glycosyltransferase [Candidatus Krumholzibacteria bacterium]